MLREVLVLGRGALAPTVQNHHVEIKKLADVRFIPGADDALDQQESASFDYCAIAVPKNCD